MGSLVREPCLPFTPISHYLDLGHPHPPPASQLWEPGPLHSFTTFGVFLPGLPLKLQLRPSVPPFRQGWGGNASGEGVRPSPT